MKSWRINPSSSREIFEFYDVKLTDITYIQTQKQRNWSFPLHSHKDSLELSLIIDGKGYLYCDRKSYEITSGDLIIKNPHILHAEKTNHEFPLEQICLSINGIQLPGLETNYFLEAEACPVIKTRDSFPLLKQLFLYILSLCHSKPLGYERTLQDMIKSILSCTTHLIPDSNNTLSTTDFPIIKEVILYLDQNYEKNISLETLSKKFYFSTYYLARKFKEETGYTINQYIINRRMGEAERMLLFEDTTIKEIAKSNGYSNLQHFYSTFKKYTGCTPVEFRNLYKNEKS